MLHKQTYGKWDPAEMPEVAYNLVKGGLWDLKRFDEWLDHCIVEAIRDVMSTESM